MSIRIATSRFYPGISRAVRSHHGGVNKCTQNKPHFRCKSSTTTANASAPKQQATSTTGSNNGSKVASEGASTAEASSSSESVPIGSTFVAMTLGEDVYTFFVHIHMMCTLFLYVSISSIVVLYLITILLDIMSQSNYTI